MWDLVKCPDLVVPVTPAVLSNVFKAREVHNDARSLLVFGGVGATAGTFEVTDDPDVAVPVWYTYTENDAAGVPQDVPTPLAGKCREIKITGPGIRIRLAVTVVAGVTFKVFKRCELGGSGQPVGFMG